MGTCCNRGGVLTVNHKSSQDQRRRSSVLFENFSKLSDYKLKYEYISILGNGGFGKVRLYADKSCPQMKYAIKTLKKNFLNINSVQSIMDEVKILRDTDHPNIVKYFETFEDEYYIHIVMEYIPGDNLFKMISNRKYSNFGEKQTQEIMQCLLKSVMFLHSKGIVHRDIKPENILFSVPGNYQSLKLIDFGLSVIKTNGKGNHRVGSPYYMAPEMLKGNYSYETDIWSIGVILYVMMTGVQPFSGRDQQTVFAKISKGAYDLKPLDKYSSELKDFIKKLIIVDRNRRISTQAALEHPWMKMHEDKRASSVIDENIIESLRNFANNNALQKEILFYLAKISKENEIQKLKQAFSEIDADNTGTIEYNEIFAIFEKLGIKPNKDEIKEIWDSLDFHHDGKVNYSEFLAGTLSSLQFTKEEKLWSAFKYFDTNNTGYISYDSVVQALKYTNANIDEDGLYEVFKSLKKPNKRLNFEEFKLVFSGEHKKLI